MNLEDIARLSGFSRSTVSRVVNNDPHVRDSTRQRVLEVIRHTHFMPNMAARGLAAGRTQVLGLVIPREVMALFSDPYYPLLIQGIAAACNTREYSVMLWLAEPDFERRMMPRILENSLVDGILVAAAIEDDPIIVALRTRSLPFITVGRLPNHNDINYIDADNRQGARDAVTHLLRLGCRRIACIRSSLDTGVGIDRLAGYREALEGRNVAVDEALIVEGDFSEMSGYLCMQRLLPLAPDAVFATSDNMALGALRALREAGMRVPQDVAVVGFDDIPLAASFSPPLTTIRQPIVRVGRLAAEMLIEVIERPSDAPRRVILPTELVIRQSCGSM